MKLDEKLMTFEKRELNVLKMNILTSSLLFYLKVYLIEDENNSKVLEWKSQFFYYDYYRSKAYKFFDIILIFYLMRLSLFLTLFLLLAITTC